MLSLKLKSEGYSCIIFFEKKSSFLELLKKIKSASNVIDVLTNWENVIIFFLALFQGETA